MSGVPAWLMQIDHLSRVAVGKLELVHIVSEPEFIEIPEAPEFCKRVIEWNNKVIPVVDLSLLIKKTSAYNEQNAVAIAIFNDETSNELKYGGIQLIDIPVIEEVTNDQGVLQSELQDRWMPVTLSCFKTQDNDLVPIIDLNRLFTPVLNSAAFQ